MYKNLFKAAANQIKNGAIEVVYHDGVKEQYGNGNPYCTLVIKDKRAYKRMVQAYDLGFGECYMDGWIDFDGPIEEAMRIYFENMHLTKIVGKLSGYRRNINSKRNQKKQIQHHYDLGNDFYSLWLDQSLTYTCAYFEDSNMSLEDAQQNKVNHVLRKLQLQKGMNLLDIGSGWGNLLFTAVQKYNINGYGVTLSKEQYDYCTKKVKKLGLEDKLTFELKNYLDVSGTDHKFDRIVSVGMFEAVGRKNIPDYFKKIDELLVNGGLSVLHSITKQDEMAGERWIDKYIFPGGYIPSLRETIWQMPEFNLRPVDIENIGQHYARTLDIWWRNFEKHAVKIENMYDERFIRMWRFWLAASYASFRYGYNDLSQIVFVKGHPYGLPLTRRFLYK